MIGIQSAIEADEVSGAGEKVRLVAARIAESDAKEGAEAIARTFDALLRRIERTAWPELLWNFSSLCEDQCPVEFTFSSEDDAVRYTTEVAGPEISEDLRLDAACECLGELALEPPPPAIVSEWRKMQANAVLRWGAWLGVRHNGNNLAAKLYIEVPRERQWGPRPLTPGSRLHMIGFNPATAANERYFRTSAPNDIELVTLLRSFRQHAHWPRLLETFSALRQMPGEAALRWTRFGYSLRTGSGATDPGGLTLFVDSQRCGGASGVRKRMQDTMGPECYRKSAYATLLANAPEDRLPEHGVVGIAVVASGKVELRVGVSALALAGIGRVLGPRPRDFGDPLARAQTPPKGSIRARKTRCKIGSPKLRRC